jgi:aminoglycoside phosphotransferase (APT) family kinase protein
MVDMPELAGVTPTPASQALAQRLAWYLEAKLPGAEDVRITELVRLSGGLSRENWAFHATWTIGGAACSQRLILRRDPAASILRTERHAEFDILQALTGTALPVPRPYLFDADGEVFDSPSMIMELLPGVSDGYALNGSRPRSVRRRLARDFLELLVGLQAVDVGALIKGSSYFADPGPAAGVRELERWEEELRRVQLEPAPELDLVLEWLHAHQTPSMATVLVHGDFKPGNALILGDQVTALLDWETAHLGDPLEDLGWITNPVRAREHQIKDLWERSHIVAAYTRLTGRAVNDDALTWWNIFACWKLSVIVLTGLREFVDGNLPEAHHPPTWLYRAMFRMIGDSW